MNHKIMPKPEPTETVPAPRRRLALVAAAVDYAGQLPHTARGDKLTAQRVDVGMIFLEMLGAEDAAEYMLANAVPAEVVARVLRSPQQRRAPPSA